MYVVLSGTSITCGNYTVESENIENYEDFIVTDLRYKHQDTLMITQSYLCHCSHLWRVVKYYLTRFFLTSANKGHLNLWWRFNDKISHFYLWPPPHYWPHCSSLPSLTNSSSKYRKHMIIMIIQADQHCHWRGEARLPFPGCHHCHRHHHFCIFVILFVIINVIVVAIVSSLLP